MLYPSVIAIRSSGLIHDSLVADEVDGELVAGGIAVGDAVGFPLEGFGFGEVELIAEQAEQRYEPLVAGLGGAGGSFLEPGDFHLIGGPGIGDLILYLGGWIEAEVLWRLVRTLPPLDSIEDVGGKDGAFEADGRVHVT